MVSDRPPSRTSIDLPVASATSTVVSVPRWSKPISTASPMDTSGKSSPPRSNRSSNRSQVETVRSTETPVSCASWTEVSSWPLTLTTTTETTASTLLMRTAVLGWTAAGRGAGRAGRGCGSPSRCRATSSRRRSSGRRGGRGCRRPGPGAPGSASAFRRSGSARPSRGPARTARARARRSPRSGRPSFEKYVNVTFIDVSTALNVCRWVPQWNFSQGGRPLFLLRS